MILTVKIDDKYIVRAKYWPEDNGVPADIEILEVHRLYGERKVFIDPAEYWQIDERKVILSVNKMLQQDPGTGDGFNVYNPNSKQFETI